MANILRGLHGVTLDGSSYTASSETARAAVDGSPYSLVGACGYAVSVAGEANAVGTIRVYSAASNGVCLAEIDVTLDASGRGGAAVVPVPGPTGLWWTQEWDTSGDYTIQLSVCPPTVSP